MTDEERMQRIDFLLDSIWQAQPVLEKKINAYFDAGDAFLAEVRKDPNSSRLSKMRQTLEKAHRDSGVYWKTWLKNADALQKELQAWKSPGKEYARFRDEAEQILGDYIRINNEYSDQSMSIQSALKAFDAAGP